MFARVFFLLVALACFSATAAMKPSLHLVFSNPFAKKVELDKNGKPIVKKAVVKKVEVKKAAPKPVAKKVEVKKACPKAAKKDDKKKK